MKIDEDRESLHYLVLQMKKNTQIIINNNSVCLQRMCENEQMEKKIITK